MPSTGNRLVMYLCKVFMTSRLYHFYITYIPLQPPGVTATCHSPRVTLHANRDFLTHLSSSNPCIKQKIKFFTAEAIVSSQAPFREPGDTPGSGDPGCQARRPARESNATDNDSRLTRKKVIVRGTEGRPLDLSPKATIIPVGLWEGGCHENNDIRSHPALLHSFRDGSPCA